MPITSAVSSQRLKIEGPFDLSNASQVCNVLLDALRSELKVVADLSGIATCDASALQVLFAARRTALLVQKRFCVAQPLPDIVVKTAAALGLELDKLKEAEDADAV